MRPAHSKIGTLEAVRERVEDARRAGRRVALANGCFDVLHAGHVRYLEGARAEADLLVVGVNADASSFSVRRLQRPPPVARSFRPSRGIRSQIATVPPARPAPTAAANPAAPPPTTATDTVFIFARQPPAAGIPCLRNWAAVSGATGLM